MTSWMYHIQRYLLVQPLWLDPGRPLTSWMNQVQRYQPLLLLWLELR